jgi:hypothetical protein
MNLFRMSSQKPPLEASQGPHSTHAHTRAHTHAHTRSRQRTGTLTAANTPPSVQRATRWAGRQHWQFQSHIIVPQQMGDQGTHRFGLHPHCASAWCRSSCGGTCTWGTPRPPATHKHARTHGEWHCSPPKQRSPYSPRTRAPSPFPDRSTDRPARLINPPAQANATVWGARATMSRTVRGCIIAAFCRRSRHKVGTHRRMLLLAVLLALELLQPLGLWSGLACRHHCKTR